MAFNADTYRANKYRRQAWEHLAEARRRRAAGWEPKDVARAVFLARNAMNLSRIARYIARLNKGLGAA